MNAKTKAAGSQAVKVGGGSPMLLGDMRRHQAVQSQHLNTTADYGGHGAYSLDGALGAGGGGVSYSSTSVNDSPDTDGGPSGY